MLRNFLFSFIILTVFTCCIVSAEEINPVVGKAGNFVLREADLDRLLASQSPETQKAVQRSPEQRANFVRQLLLTKATAARARKEGFDRKPEVKEVISNLIDQFIAQEYLSKVVIADISVSDDDIKKYYLGHEKDFLVAEAARVRHIYISSPKDSSAELKEKARSKAEMILNQVKKGEDFAKIAKEQSEDADSAVKGGDLGFITAGKTNSPDFEKAVFALKAGEVGSLVETPFGYHVIRVDERKESRTATIEEGKDYIISLLKEQGRQKKGQEFLDALSKESGLEIVGEKTESAK